MSAQLYDKLSTEENDNDIELSTILQNNDADYDADSEATILPLEIIEMILYHIPFKFQFKMMCVCKDWFLLITKRIGTGYYWSYQLAREQNRWFNMALQCNIVDPSSTLSKFEIHHCKLRETEQRLFGVYSEGDGDNNEESEEEEEEDDYEDELENIDDTTALLTKSNIDALNSSISSIDSSSDSSIISSSDSISISSSTTATTTPLASSTPPTIATTKKRKRRKKRRTKATTKWTIEKYVYAQQKARYYWTLRRILSLLNLVKLLFFITISPIVISIICLSIIFVYSTFAILIFPPLLVIIYKKNQLRNFFASSNSNNNTTYSLSSDVMFCFAMYILFYIGYPLTLLFCLFILFTFWYGLFLLLPLPIGCTFIILLNILLGSNKMINDIKKANRIRSKTKQLFKDKYHDLHNKLAFKFEVIPNICVEFIRKEDILNIDKYIISKDWWYKVVIDNEEDYKQQKSLSFAFKWNQFYQKTNYRSSVWLSGNWCSKDPDTDLSY